MASELKLERSIEQWRNMNPATVLRGSQAQIMYALEDARKDILALAAALSTPVAPVSLDATGKCGELETVEHQVRSKLNGHWVKDNFLSQQISPDTERRELVARSQAEEVLAAERAEKDNFKRQAREHFDAFCALRNDINELVGDMPSLEGVMLEAGPEDAPQYQAVVEAVKHALAAKDARIKELEEEHPEQLEATVKSLFDKAVALDADNTALTARVQTLEQVNAKLCDDMLDYELKIAERDVSLNELKQKLADKFSFTSDDDALAVLERYGHKETGNGIIKADMRSLDDMCRAAVAYLCAEWDFVFQDEVELNREALEAKLAAANDLVVRAQVIIPDHYVNWHRDARAVLGGKPSC